MHAMAAPTRTVAPPLETASVATRASAAAPATSETAPKARGITVGSAPLMRVAPTIRLSSATGPAEDVVTTASATREHPQSAGTHAVIGTAGNATATTVAPHREYVVASSGETASGTGAAPTAPIARPATVDQEYVRNAAHTSATASSRVKAGDKTGIASTGTIASTVKTAPVEAAAITAMIASAARIALIETTVSVVADLIAMSGVLKGGVSETRQTDQVGLGKNNAQIGLGKNNDQVGPGKNVGQHALRNRFSPNG